jgi:hypothetical protein
VQAHQSFSVMEFQPEAGEGLWQHCKNMVQTLRIAAREKSFYDPAVRAVRTQLRTAYEAFLLQDYHGAQVSVWLVLDDLMDGYCSSQCVFAHPASMVFVFARSIGQCIEREVMQVLAYRTSLQLLGSM